MFNDQNKRSEFVNREYVGNFAEVEFDTYVNLGGGKEEVKTVSAKMHYVEQGSGEPLILVHGITQSLYTYRKNIKELSQKYRVIAVDLLGYGYSEKADITYSVEENALSLEAFMNSLKIPSANFCAFGESWAYVMDIVVHNPQRVKKAILVSPGFVTNNYPRSLRSLASPMGGLVGNSFSSPATIRKYLSDCFFDKTLVTDKLVKEYARPLAMPDTKQVLKRSFTAYDDREIFQKLSNIQHDILLVAGVDDIMHGTDYAKHIREHLKHGYFEKFKNCGYFPHVEKYLKFNELVVEFLNYQPERES